MTIHRKHLPNIGTGFPVDLIPVDLIMTRGLRLYTGEVIYLIMIMGT